MPRVNLLITEPMAINIAKVRKIETLATLTAICTRALDLGLQQIAKSLPDLSSASDVCDPSDPSSALDVSNASDPTKESGKSPVEAKPEWVLKGFGSLASIIHEETKLPSAAPQPKVEAMAPAEAESEPQVNREPTKADESEEEPESEDANIFDELL